MKKLPSAGGDGFFVFRVECKRSPPEAAIIVTIGGWYKIKILQYLLLIL